MPGSPSDSGPMQLVGMLVAAVAVVGYVLYDWQFGGEVQPIPAAIAVACVVLAVAVTVYRRYGTGR